MTKKLKTKIKSKNASKKKEITKPFIKEELKIRLPKIVMYDSHPDSVYKSTGIALAKAIDGDKDEKLIALMKENIFKLDDFSIQHGNLAKTVSGDLSTTIVEMTNNLIEEYKCVSTLEKTLCETIANSYGKILSISKRLNNNLEFTHYDKKRNQFIGILSKELDRANRMYLMGLNNLIEIKRPKMNINVKAKNAFIGENQQFNNNHGENEIIRD